MSQTWFQTTLNTREGFALEESHVGFSGILLGAFLFVTILAIGPCIRVLCRKRHAPSPPSASSLLHKERSLYVTWLDCILDAPLIIGIFGICVYEIHGMGVEWKESRWWHLCYIWTSYFGVRASYYRKRRTNSNSMHTANQTSVVSWRMWVNDELLPVTYFVGFFVLCIPNDRHDWIRAFQFIYIICHVCWLLYDYFCPVLPGLPPRGPVDTGPVDTGPGDTPQQPRIKKPRESSPPPPSVPDPLILAMRLEREHEAEQRKIRHQSLCTDTKPVCIQCKRSVDGRCMRIGCNAGCMVWYHRSCHKHVHHHNDVGDACVCGNGIVQTIDYWNDSKKISHQQYEPPPLPPPTTTTPTVTAAVVPPSRPSRPMADRTHDEKQTTRPPPNHLTRRAPRGPKPVPTEFDKKRKTIEWKPPVAVSPLLPAAETRRPPRHRHRERKPKAMPLTDFIREYDEAQRIREQDNDIRWPTPLSRGFTA